MTSRNTTRRSPAPRPPRLSVVPAADNDVVPMERTGNRILAFRDSMQMRDGATVSFNDYQNGAEAIARLASGADGYERPQYRLSPTEAAAVLRFITDSEPRSPADWWEDPEAAPSRVCGYQFVLGAIAKAIGPAQISDPAPASQVAQATVPTSTKASDDSAYLNLDRRLFKSHLEKLRHAIFQAHSVYEMTAAALHEASEGDAGSSAILAIEAAQRILIDVADDLDSIPFVRAIAAGQEART